MAATDTWQRIQQQRRYRPGEGLLQIRTIDLHTGGEPLRVVLDGFPLPPGRNVLERRRHVRAHCDHLRRALMHEPRGHADMYGCLLVPPNDDGADFGVIFMHNEGYSTMCGHATIALGRLAVEMGWVEARAPTTEVVIDAPCGRLRVFVSLSEKKVRQVAFLGVPSFVLALDQKVEVPGLGSVSYDLAYGGAFYAYVSATDIGLELVPANYRTLIAAGMAIKRAVQQCDDRIRHPFEEELSFLYGTIFIGEPASEGVDSRNVCIFAEGEVDRSPTGSGLSGRLAIHYARGEIGLGQHMRVESIVGSVFEGSIEETLTYGPYQAVVPRVAGQAWITGLHTFLIDPADPFREGFFLR